MRILTLSDTFYPHHPGGSQEVARRLSRGYQALGHDVAVVTCLEPTIVPVDHYESLPLITLEQQAGLDYLPGGYAAPQTTRSLIQAIQQFKPDIIHAHNIHSALGWEWVHWAYDNGVKTCLTFHDAMTVSQGKLIPPATHEPNQVIHQTFFRELNRFRSRYCFGRKKRILETLKKVDQLITVSEALSKQLRANGVPEMKVILNGVDLLEKSTVALGDKPSLVYLGRPTAEKGLHVLMRAMSQVDRDWTLFVAGNVSDEQKNYCKTLSGDANVEYVGWVSGDEKVSLIDRCWAGVTLSTYPDPCPLSNYEPMARARPILGTLWGGTPEVLRQGHDGWLVDPRQVSDIVNALNEMYARPKEVDNRGRQAYQRVMDRFQWKDVIFQYVNVFENLLDK